MCKHTACFALSPSSPSLPSLLPFYVEKSESQELLGVWKGLETSSSKNLGKLDIGEGGRSVSFPHYHDSFGVNFSAGQSLHMSRFSFVTK